MTLAIQELLLFLSLGFAVVAFGANPDWARHIFCMLVFFAGAFIILTAPPAPVSRSLRRSTAILAALMAAPLLQLIPLPPAFQQALSPCSRHHDAQAGPDRHPGGIGCPTKLSASTPSARWNSTR